MEKLFSPAVMQLQKELEYRNYSSRTVYTYCLSMQCFEQFYAKELCELSSKDLKNYLHHLMTVKKCSTSYVNQNISAFKIYVKDVKMSDWEAIEIKRPRLPKTLPTVLSLEEVKRMIDLTCNLKHRMMLQTMYTAGLRKSELLQLKPQDIDSKEGFILVRQGKGKKDRRTLLSQETLEKLRMYYTIYRPKVYLFESRESSGNAICAKTLDYIVKKAANKAGVSKPVSSHTLRHSFATHLLDQGVNIKAIQSFLGHTSIRTTSIYLHLSDAGLKKIVSPFDLL